MIPRDPAPEWAHREIGRLRAALAHARDDLERLHRFIDFLKECPVSDPQKWLANILATCVAALEKAQGRKRAYVVVELRGDRAGSWLEVYPGVKGQVFAFGRSSAIVEGQVVETRLTKVKVCAKTFLRALERDGVIRREEVAAPPGADVAQSVVLP